jgi:hypothetical protein
MPAEAVAAESDVLVTYVRLLGILPPAGAPSPTPSRALRLVASKSEVFISKKTGRTHDRSTKRRQALTFLKKNDNAGYSHNAAICDERSARNCLLMR